MTELPEPAATIVRLTEKLQEDLAFAAPELWALHIEKRLAQAFEAGEEATTAAEQRLRTSIAALDDRVPDVCSCDITDGDWAGEGRCVGCGSHGPHKADECGKTVTRRMGLSEFRAAVLALLEASDSPKP